MNLAVIEACVWDMWGHIGKKVDFSHLLTNILWAKRQFFFSGKNGKLDDEEDEGTRLFQVNVVGPQFNLHSEEANVS